MPTPLRRRLRLARRGAGYAVALVLVLLAMAIGVANQLLPLAERHPDRIAAWLGERSGRVVAFDRVRTQWTRRGPLLELEGLRIGSPGASGTGADMIAIGDAEMLVSLYAGLLPGIPFSELRLRGLDLTLERGDDGRWQVRGLPGQQRPGGDPLAALEGLGELQVIDGRLTVAAPSLGIQATVPRVDLRVRVDGDRVRAGLRAWPTAGATPLDAVLDFDRRQGDGRVYAGAPRADLADWSELLRFAGVRGVSGRGRAQAWGELRDHRLALVTAAADLEGLGLQGAPLRDSRGLVTAPQQRFDSIQLLARWRLRGDGWRLDVPRARLVQGDDTQVLDGLLLAGGRHYGLMAERVDAGPLLALAALSDRMPPRIRQWLVAAAPDVRLGGIELAGVRGGPLRASGRLEALAFSPVGDAPGLEGLAGEVEGDARGVVFHPDAGATVRFDWPSGFGIVHDVALDGSIVGWRQDAGWQVATSGLHLAGERIGARLRGGLHWQGDGTRPRMELSADIDEAPLSAAHGFWVRHLMAPAVVRWLEGALVDGRIREGQALVSGDLDDWPFTAGPGQPVTGQSVTGVFRAQARISGGVLKFQPDWPAAEAVEAQASFTGEGFQVEGSGSIAGFPIEAFQAGIAHYREGVLEVAAKGGGDAARLLALLRDSPLQDTYADTLDNLVVRGPARVSFDLHQPLRDRGGAARLGGNVALAGARLEDRRWDLAFDQVRGQARYDRGGFSADDLQVRHSGRPGRLGLRAGSSVRDRGQVFEAELEASLTATELLARAPQLDWLRPYLSGRSDWTIAVAIPKAAAGNQASMPSRLRLSSGLVGTSLGLPAPLAKPAAATLPARVDVALPLERGEVQVALGQVMALRARSQGARTGVRVALGTGTIDALPPASGLVVAGRARELDAIDWIAFANRMAGKGADGKGADGQGGLPLQRIDVTAERLLLLGGAFPDARVQVVPATTVAGTAVQVQGSALQGGLIVPDAEGAAVSGRFERLHWRSASAPSTGAGGAKAEVAPPTTTVPATAAAAGRAEVDPAAIPPLAFDIADLRFGDARLGTASLRTRPVATGMSIERLQTAAPAQRLQLSGDWLGRGASGQTRLDVGIDSDDFGALLNGLGFGGRLAGGKGTARLQGRWPGSPADFTLARLEGGLELDAREGRLLEVEPGAGRFLGLLSIAELPRRLTLDFRDFFEKGFAFNQLAGKLQFAQGRARSDGLVIDGPAAEIRIRGSADLRAQTFDQTIEVLPKAGNVLTAVGAIAGGPVGAAIGAVATAVLQKPLRQAAARTYRVTGPWKDPEVKVIGREQGRLSAAAQPPPTG